jgi:hypothetical protein
MNLFFLCMVDCASCIIFVWQTNMMRCLSSLYWVTTPLCLFVAHRQEVECIYVANGTCYTAELSVGGHHVGLLYKTRTDGHGLYIRHLFLVYKKCFHKCLCSSSKL